jgi:hypothetical protein
MGIAIIALLTSTTMAHADCDQQCVEDAVKSALQSQQSTVTTFPSVNAICQSYQDTSDILRASDHAPMTDITTWPAYHTVCAGQILTHKWYK